MAVPKIPPVSPFPKASVARILDPHNDKLGATLVARRLGYLAIKVTFHKEPLYGLEVKFYETAADGSKGAQVGATFKTDRAGKASLDTLVAIGVYLVEIENQTTPALVSTVTDLKAPYVVPLPVDRPYYDFDEACEFDDEHREVVDYVSAGGGDGMVDPEDDDGPGVMTVAIALDPAAKLDDYPHYLLESSDGSYSSELSARDALTDRGGWKQVVFRQLVPDLTYRLTRIVDPDYRVIVFDGESYDSIVEQEHDAGAALEGHQGFGYAVGGPGDVQWGAGS